MAQYKVPQNIDMQDKIFGPLTLFQFLYLLIGGMFSYALFKLSIYLFIAFGIPIIAIAITLALVKVQEQPFSKFLISLIHYVVTPKTWVWHRGLASRVTIASGPGEKVGAKKVKAKLLDRGQMSRIAQALDRRNSL